MHTLKKQQVLSTINMSALQKDSTKFSITSSEAAPAPDAVEKGTPVSLQHVFQCKLMAFRRPYRKHVHFLHQHSPKQRHLISLGKVSVDNIKKNSWVVSKVDLREEIRPGDAVAVIPTDIKVLGSLDHHTYRVWWQTTQKNHFIDETFVYSANSWRRRSTRSQVIAQSMTWDGTECRIPLQGMVRCDKKHCEYTLYKYGVSKTIQNLWTSTNSNGNR